MEELGHLLARLGPVFGLMFMMLIIMTDLALFALSTRRLVHRG
jgi:hypothetical protein